MAKYASIVYPSILQLSIGKFKGALVCKTGYSHNRNPTPKRNFVIEFLFEDCETTDGARSRFPRVTHFQLKTTFETTTTTIITIIMKQPTALT